MCKRQFQAHFIAPVAIRMPVLRTFFGHEKEHVGCGRPGSHAGTAADPEGSGKIDIADLVVQTRRILCGCGFRKWIASLYILQVSCKKGVVLDMADLMKSGGGLDRYDPSSTFGLSDFFRNIFGDPLAGTFRVDVLDDKDHYELVADLPGLHRENIDVQAKNGYLTITANMDSSKHEEGENFVIHERRSGTVSRSFAIGDVNEDEIHAEYKDGLLHVTLPKGSDNDDQPRRISVD